MYKRSVPMIGYDVGPGILENGLLVPTFINIFMNIVFIKRQKVS